MHFHATAASRSGDALAGYQAAETAVALRRARELRDSASKIRASSLEVEAEVPTDPETVSMVAAWSGAVSGAASGIGQGSRPRRGVSPPSISSGGLAERQASGEHAAVPAVERSPEAAPVSFWA